MNRRSFLLGATALGALSGCRTTQSTLGRVVVYCSVDDVYARPILRDIETNTGLRVDALYDTEAAKTAGLATRIRAEKSRPRGDVFWSSALLQTLLLGREGLLQPYVSPSASDIAPAFKDPNGLWTAIGTRRRVVVYNTSLKKPPHSLNDLLRPELKGKIVISNPQFGTASDWVAALGVRWGIERTRKYFEALKANGVQVVPGNSVAAQRVARGEALAGITDIDDFQAEHAKNPDLRLSQTVAPDAINAVDVPGSAAMLEGAPHPANAQKFLDALLQLRTERQLMGVMHGVASARQTSSATPIPNDAARWPDAWKALREPLNTILVGD